METTLDAALAAVAAGPITLYGVGGSGCTVAAGALVARIATSGRARRTATLRLHACSELSDAVRALGLALDTMLPGDETQVREALARGDVAILVDDADLAIDVARQILEMGPQCAWVFTGRDPVAGTGFELTGQRGAVSPAAIEAIPPGAEILADLPMGLPSTTIPLASAVLLATPERVVLRRSVREALGAKGQPASESLAAALRDRLEEAHGIAADIEPRADTDDLVFFRTAARRVADPDLAAVAAATAARMSMRFFEASDALAIVREQIELRSPGRPAAAGLLRWLEGDALLDQGSEDQAEAAHRYAAQALDEAGLTRIVATLARRCADRHAARGNTGRSRQWLSVARTALSTDADPVAWADTLRIAGNLAAQAGELVGAAALYDEAASALDRGDGGGRERAAVRLGQIGLEVARGQYAVAEQLIAQAERDAPGDATVAGSVAFRRAELALRRGKRDEARAQLGIAVDRFRRAGSRRGLLLHARLAGDLEAVCGDRAAASAAYTQAIALCVRARDVVALGRVLRRALLVEREGLPGPHVDDLQAHLDLVEVLLKVR